MKLSNALKDTLSFIATGEGLAKTGLNIDQVDAATQQLVELKLVEKSDSANNVRGYVLTSDGKALRTRLRAKRDAY